MNSRKSKIFKTFGIILISLVVLIIGLLYYKAQSYLNDNLSAYVSKKSKGKYELIFNDLQINFSHWGFQLNNVKFFPSDSIINNSKVEDSIKSNRLYSFSSPSIQISKIKLVKLLFFNQLEIGEILISQPELQVHGKSSLDEDNKNNISSILLELKPLVTKSFKYIKINKIEFINASFNFYNLLGDTHKLSNAKNITIGISKFYTDSLLLPNPEKMFDAEDVYFRMHDYLNILGDSIHKLSAETITYSLKKSQLEGLNILLIPINKNISTHSKYSISVPRAIIKSKMINEFYKYTSIPIDSMIVIDAKIHFYPGQKKIKSSLNKTIKFDLYELIEKEFSSVSIANFKMDNTKLLLYRNQSDTVSQQEIKDINLNLHDFLLDSISLNDTSRIFYARDIDFSVSEYKLILGDNIHHLEAENVNISTKRKSVFRKNIHLYPQLLNQSKINSINTIDASCDSIRLDLFDFKNAYHTQRFFIHRINLFNPELQLIKNELPDLKNNVANDSTENFSFVYKLISNYVDGIYAKQVAVQKGKFKVVNKTGVWQKGLIESYFRLFLNGFALDEISAKRSDRLFFANQIELNFDNYQMQLADHIHKLTIDNFSLSTQKKQASLINLHLFPVSKENIEKRLVQTNKSELYEFTIQELTFTNADFHNAFFNKRFKSDLITIKQPVIYYENFSFLKPSKETADFKDLYLLISNYLDDIYLEKVDIPDGTIQLINHNRKGRTISLDNHFTLGLEKLQINKERFGKKKLLFSEQVDFAVRDHLIKLSDNVHVIKAETVGFSTKRKEIYVTNAKMYPESNSKNFQNITWNIQLLIPEIRIQGISVEDLYFDQKIIADNVLINSPEIRLYQKNVNTKQVDLKDINFPMPKEIETISMGKFNMTNATLKIFSELGMQPYLLVQSDLKMESQNIVIQKDALTNEPVFKSGIYTAGLFQFKFTPKVKNQQISIEELNFSTSEKHIIGRHLVVKPKVMNNLQDQFEMQIPSFSMNGLDIDKAYKNYQYFFESIIIDRPLLFLFNNAKDSIKINPYNVNLYSHFESFADIFSTKSLKVNDIGLTVIKNGNRFVQEKISFDLTNFRIDNKPSSGFLHADDFAFSIQNFKRQDAGKNYLYTIGNSSYSSINDRFSAINLQITPLVGKDQFNRQKGYQTDYFKGKIDSVSIEHPDIKRWFENNEIKGSNMSAKGMVMDIYRDKRLPFNNNRRPKMLQDMIKELPYPISIDSLKLINSTINYIEKPDQGEETGQIKFSGINVTLKPFTNMIVNKANIPDFTVSGNATIMDSCQMNVIMNYSMNDPDNSFTASGSLKPFNMQILNPVLEPLAMVSIKSGRVDKFRFYFRADRTQARGQLLFGYNDLRISVLELKNGNTKEAKFLSFLANSLMLKSKNPRGKELIPDEIYFHRDQKRSVLNYWWKSVFSGVRNTLGIKDNKEEEENYGE